jgi:hypothetical protein
MSKQNQFARFIASFLAARYRVLADGRDLTLDELKTAIYDAVDGWEDEGERREGR